MNPLSNSVSRRHFLSSATAATAAALFGTRSIDAAPTNDSGMRISGLEIIRSAPPHVGGWNWIFLKITTDSGIYG